MPAQSTELESLDTLRAEHQRKLASMVHIMSQDAKDRPLARDGIDSPVPGVPVGLEEIVDRPFRNRIGDHLPGCFQPSHQLCGIRR